MILRATEEAIQGLLQAAIDEVTESASMITVLRSDEDENKPSMPYIVIQCVEAEEQIAPGSGIFKVSGILAFKSHTKEMDAEDRQTVLDAINNFAYDSTAAKLSEVEDFHCHGWHPTTGVMSTDPEQKATVYEMRYWVYCMAMNNE